MSLGHQIPFFESPFFTSTFCIQKNAVAFSQLAMARRADRSSVPSHVGLLAHFNSGGFPPCSPRRFFIVSHETLPFQPLFIILRVPALFLAIP